MLKNMENGEKTEITLGDKFFESFFDVYIQATQKGIADIENI